MDDAKAPSASVERVFSIMKRIKTPLRNRLKSTTQDALIQISMTGPSIAGFDPLPAALKWKSQGNRRIRLLHSGTTASANTDCAAINADLVIVAACECPTAIPARE